MKNLFFILICSLLVAPASFSQSVPFGELREAIFQKDWSRASAALQQVSSEELLRPMMDMDGDPSTALWLALFPDERGDAENSFLTASAQFPDEQQQFLNQLVDKNPSQVNNPSGEQKLLPIFTALIYYDRIIQKNGIETREGLDKKVDFLVSRGANLDAQQTFFGVTTSVAMHIGGYGQSSYALDYLFEKVDYNFTKPHLYHFHRDGMDYKTTANLLSLITTMDNLDPSSEYGQKTLVMVEKWLSKYPSELKQIMGFAAPDTHIFFLLATVLMRTIDEPAQEGTDKTILLILSQINALVRAGLDPNLPLPLQAEGNESDPISMVEYLQKAELDYLFTALIEKGISLGDVQQMIAEVELSEAVRRRDYAKIDRIIESNPPTILNERFQSPLFRYSPGVLNNAVWSLAEDGDVAATIQLIKYLIKKGASVTTKSGFGYNVYMEVGWLMQNIRSSPEFAQNRSQLLAAARMLSEHLEGNEFQRFVATNDLSSANGPLTCSEVTGGNRAN